MNVTPHVARNTSGRSTTLPDVVAESAGFAISQEKRKLIEPGFGWAKTIGGMAHLMVRGHKEVYQLFVLTMTGSNLTRMRTRGKIRMQGA